MVGLATFDTIWTPIKSFMFWMRDGYIIQGSKVLFLNVSFMVKVPVFNVFFHLFIYLLGCCRYTPFSCFNSLLEQSQYLNTGNQIITWYDVMCLKKWRKLFLNSSNRTMISGLFPTNSHTM